MDVVINDESTEEERFLREKKRKKAFEANDNFLTTDHEFIYQNVLHCAELKEIKP